MAMTLKQVFTMWACEPGHTALAARSHDAVQKILMKKYNVKGCITCVDGDQWARIMEAKPKIEETMREPKDPKEKKPRGRKPSEEKKESTAAADALKVFTDDELLEELDRRGWYGEIRKIQVVTLGKKED